MADTAVEEAVAAAALVDRDPRRALPVVERATLRARRERDAVAASTAEGAWGFALMLCGSMTEAVGHLRRAITWGEQVDRRDLVAQAQTRLGYALGQLGRGREALGALDAALAVLKGGAAGRARANRGLVLRTLGLSRDALAEYKVAVRALRRAGDTVGLGRALINRSLLHLDLYQFTAAEADLVEAEQLARNAGYGLAQGLIAENRSRLERYRGNVPAALQHLDRAEALLREHASDDELGMLSFDRAELLLSVGLGGEAMVAADRAIAGFRRAGRRLMVPEARLLRARAATLQRQWWSAVGEADRAHRAFVSQQRPVQAALARLERATALAAAGALTARRGADLGGVIATLSDTGGLLAEEVEARLLHARSARSGVGTGGARRQLERVGERARQGPAAVRARGWYARALLRSGAGDQAGTVRAARAGLRILDEYAAALGASDVRVHAAGHRAELVGLGLRTALRDGRPERVFEWAERGRASQLTRRPARPVADAALAQLLAELRRLTADNERGPSPAKVRHQVELEHRIRDRSRQLGDGRAGDPAAPVRWPALAAVLGDVALVEFVTVEGELLGLAAVDGHLRSMPLGPADAVADLVECIPFALHRLSRTGRAGHLHDAAQLLLDDAAARLDAMLLGPFRADLADRPLVVVPTSVLHSLAWSCLPSCRGRAVTVSPSATLWHITTTRPETASERPAVAVATGPGLPGATDEAAAVAAIHGVEPLLGSAATVAAVLAAMGRADLVHLAAHGRLSADNPLFSALVLADGRLVVYDVDALARVPDTVVLAACDTGRSAVYAGDELLGLTAALLAGGATQIVASVLPIPDAETAPLMVALHRRLAAGEAPAPALAGAQVEVGDDSRRAMAAAAGFVSLGAGFRPVGGR